jgi:hypothetical protein
VCYVSRFITICFRPPCMSHSRAGNQTDVASVCRLVPSLLKKLQLSRIFLDHRPSACIRHAAWQGEGLPLPPSDAVPKGWTPVLEFLRVRGACARSRNVQRARRVLRHRTPLQLPSRHLQAHRAMSCALAAASALVVPGRCRVPARFVQHHESAAGDHAGLGV